VSTPLSDLTKPIRASFARLGLDQISTRLGIALLIVSAVFFAANFADKAWVGYQVAQEKRAKIELIRQTEGQIRALNAQLIYMKTRAYYVQAARPFGYQLAGDIPVTISVSPGAAVSGDVAPPVATPRPKRESIWRKIISAIVPGIQ